MKRFLALLTALACTLSPAIADNPKADAKAVVTSGNARFTVLTPQLIRMEWSADGQFEDRATLTFVNRETPVPEFKVRESKSKLTITTPALTLTYLKNGKFSDKNLKAVFTLNGKEVVWTPGMENPQNLLGTTRTLDGADGSKLKEPMEQGILSRAGWSLIDDSQRHVLTPDGSEWEEWVEARPEGDRQDLYLFAYGHDYKQALADYALVAGRAPMPPKYTLGYWWSRYWQYSDNEFVDLVNKLKSMDVPIDVLIVDMDWHETWGLRKSNSPKDEYGQRIGWTGYTWQKELFPSPANFLKWTENEELKVALNLHPASGIQPYEAVYDDFTKEYGWSEKGKSVPFKIDERKWADAYFKTVLEPMERDGVDFWWLDWQQWKESKYTPGLSNTFWLNHTFFNHAERQNPGLRPFIYHRWGGLGSHLSAGIFGRHLRHMAHARLPALLHGYGFERQLRLVGPRHRRPHVPQDTEGDRPGTLHALAAIRRIHSDLQNPFDQRPAHRTLHLVLSRPYVPHARRHPPALHAGTLYL